MSRWFKLVLLATLALLVLRTALVRAHGLNPESLWYDDLAWATFAKFRDVHTILFARSNAPPGFLALLGVSSWVFKDPEWSMQIVPFVAGLASIPVMAAVTRRVTGSDGLALLAAAVTALNPLLAHYTIFVKAYTLDFLFTSLLLYFAVILLSRETLRPVDAARFVGAAAVAFPVSVTSPLISIPAINAIAIRDWRERRGRVPFVALTILVFEVGLAAAALWFRFGHGENLDRIGIDFVRRVRRLPDILHFATHEFKRVAERSLPSWWETQPWDPQTVPMTLVFIVIGLVWVLALPATRRAGLLLASSLGLFLFVTYTKLYWLTTFRRSICSFPLFITLAVMGVHALTQLLPRREMVRMAIGLAVAVFAIAAPVKVAYWDVNDSRLASSLPTTIEQADGLVLSPAGVYLTAYYGPWRASFQRESLSGVSIFRQRTLQLPIQMARTRRLVEQFVTSVRPPGVAYVAFRNHPLQTEIVLDVLEEYGYVPTAAETTARGTLYIARRVQHTASESQ